MLGRAFFGPDLVRVSLPGVEVESPPAITEEFLAVDSSWPKVERLHAVGFLSNVSLSRTASGIPTAIARFYFDPLPDFPFVHVSSMEVGTNLVLDSELFNVGTIINDLSLHYGRYLASVTRDHVTLFKYFFDATIPVVARDFSILVFKPS